MLAAEPSTLAQKSGSPAGWPPQSPWWHGCSSLQWTVAPFPPATPTGAAPFLSGTDSPAQTLMLCLACGSGILPTVKAERQRGFLLRDWKHLWDLRISSEQESLLSHPLSPHPSLRPLPSTYPHPPSLSPSPPPNTGTPNLHPKLLVPAGPESHLLL